MKRHLDVNHGFTLIEIMVAVAILGTAMLVLLEAHYGALHLYGETQEAIVSQMLVERAVYEAEMHVQAGELKGTGDFGKSKTGCSFTFDAQPMGENYVPLYFVNVSVTTPTDSQSVQMLVYQMGY